MSAVRETLFAAIEAALASAAAEVERMPSGDPANFPALHILDHGQAREPETEAGATRYAVQLSIEGYVQHLAGGNAGAVAHAALNQLHADTVRAVMALVDAVPGLENIEEEAMRVSVLPLGAVRALAFSADFAATIVTRRGDPEAA